MNTSTNAKTRDITFAEALVEAKRFTFFYRDSPEEIERGIASLIFELRRQVPQD